MLLPSPRFRSPHLNSKVPRIRRLEVESSVLANPEKENKSSLSLYRNEYKKLVLFDVSIFVEIEYELELVLWVPLLLRCETNNWNVLTRNCSSKTATYVWLAVAGSTLGDQPVNT
jgi:hypothetical protein